MRKKQNEREGEKRRERERRGEEEANDFHHFIGDSFPRSMVHGLEIMVNENGDIEGVIQAEIGIESQIRKKGVKSCGKCEVTGRTKKRWSKNEDPGGERWGRLHAN